MWIPGQGPDDLKTSYKPKLFNNFQKLLKITTLINNKTKSQFWSEYRKKKDNYQQNFRQPQYQQKKTYLKLNQTIYKINSKQTCAQKLKKTDNTLKKEITQLKNVTNSKTSIKNTYKNLLGNGVELQTILDLKIISNDIPIWNNFALKNQVWVFQILME